MSEPAERQVFVRDAWDAWAIAVVQRDAGLATQDEVLAARALALTAGQRWDAAYDAANPERAARARRKRERDRLTRAARIGREIAPMPQPLLGEAKEEARRIRRAKIVAERAAAVERSRARRRATA